MTEGKKKSTSITRRDPGFFSGLSLQLRLVLRLIADPRVSPLFKVLPIGSMVYLLFPDLAPGPIDDAVIIGLGTYMFVELCPPHVVEEHKAALMGIATPSAPPAAKEEIVDAEFEDASSVDTEQ